jgi:DNA-directed RNA polymerase specialized sigma24 family protein
MSESNIPFTDRLRQSDAEATACLLNRMLPRVQQALRRRFGVTVGWRDPEDFAQSIARTVLRRVQDDALPDDMTDEQFEGWLVRVASNKVIDALRRRRTEQDHAARLADLWESARAESAADGEEQVWMKDLVEAVEADLADDMERAVFRGKLAEEDEETIAFAIKRTPRTVRAVWRRIRERMEVTLGRLFE